MRARTRLKAVYLRLVPKTNDGGNRLIESGRIPFRNRYRIDVRGVPNDTAQAPAPRTNRYRRAPVCFEMGSNIP